MGRLVKNPQLAPNAGIAASGLMPGGTTGERPDVTTDGQMRYNSSNSAMEYTIDAGSTWQQVGAVGLSTVTQDSFTGDAIETDFTFASINVASTTDILVFVGGVFQNPATSYTIISAGAEISFTSAPPNLEVIVVLHGLNEVI